MCRSFILAMKEKVSIYIDGGNFYHLVLKKLGIDQLAFSYENFAAFLANDREIGKLGKRFYVGTVREKEGDERSKRAMSKQTSLFTVLLSTHWQIKTSKLKTRYEEIKIDQRVENYQKLNKLGIKSIKIERLREKGIDVKIATDLIVGAVDNKYDTAIVISSDSDLIPAIDWVRNRTKKKVEYIGFSIPDPIDPRKSTRPLLSLINKTDIQRTLVEADIRKFVNPTLFDT